MERRLRVLCALAALAAAGCLSNVGGFVCADDGACHAGRKCLGGGCAQPDGQCESGYRWDQTAERAGQCADAPPATTCGNGVLDQEAGETCDESAGMPCLKPADCDDQQPCTNDHLEGAPCKLECRYDYKGFDDGASCTVLAQGGARPGKCYGHACCVGCVAGKTCQGGQTVEACGRGGAACQSCAAQVAGNDCRTARCLPDGTCATEPAPDGRGCKSDSGVCLAGTCCQGCVAGGKCLPGTDVKSCGAKGVACAACPTGGNCVSSGGGGTGGTCTGCVPACAGGAECGSDGCGGNCGVCPGNKKCSGAKCVCASDLPEASDAQCGNQLDDDCDGAVDCGDTDCAVKACASTKFCWKLACTEGCFVDGNFYFKGAINPINPCQECDPAFSPVAWKQRGQYEPCTAPGGFKGACTAGGVCCTGCITQSGCVPIGNTQTWNQCGKEGAACATCDDNNACTGDFCAQGVCGHQRRPDGTPCEALSCTGINLCNLVCAGAFSCLTYASCANGTCDKGRSAQKCCTSTNCSNCFQSTGSN